MRAGPAGNRELRIAIESPGSSATSTQLPLGLLALDFRQRTSSSPAGILFLTCNFSSLHEGKRTRRGYGKCCLALCSLTDRMHVQTFVQRALQT